MSSGKYLSFAGQTIVCDGIRVGSTSSGGDGTEMTSTEVLYLDGLTAGTATASKAVVLDSSKDLSEVRNIEGASFQQTVSTAVTADSTPAALTFTGGLNLVSYTSAATDVVDLPTNVAADVGKQIHLYAVQGFEVQSADASATINGVTVGATNECAIVAGSYVIMTLVADNTWLARGHSILGAPLTLVPDSL